MQVEFYQTVGAPRLYIADEKSGLRMELTLPTDVQLSVVGATTRHLLHNGTDLDRQQLVQLAREVLEAFGDSS